MAKKTAKKTTKTTAKSKTATTARKTSTKRATRKKPAAKTKKTSATSKSADNPVLNPERREGDDRRQELAPVSGNRRKVQRRRQIDPTTCERDYTNDEIEFMQAMDEYKRKSGRMFPTCSEILEVVRAMGYERVGQSATTPPATETAAASGEAVAGTSLESEFSSYSESL